jgi:hypothetical protein
MRTENVGESVNNGGKINYKQIFEDAALET